MSVSRVELEQTLAEPGPLPKLERFLRQFMDQEDAMLARQDLAFVSAIKRAVWVGVPLDFLKQMVALAAESVDAIKAPSKKGKKK